MRLHPTPGEAPSTVTVTRPASPAQETPSARAVARTVFIVVLSAFAVYLVYLLRTPIAYVVLAAFIAACASAPVNVLSGRMKRGAAIALVYLLIVLVPLIIIALLIVPLVNQTVRLLENLPAYVQDLEEEFQSNERLRELNEDYDLTTKLEDLATDLAASLDDAALALADVGAGVVSSLFALVTILVLSMFMVSSGRGWMEAFLRTRPEREAQAVRRAGDRMAMAVSSYVGGALFQATVAGVAAWLMLVILGISSPLTLALVIAILDLIPMVGATIGAVIVGVVILFAGSTADVIVWAIFAIAYQQFENYVVQPRIQSKAVQLDPFIVVIAALIGGTLLGVVGALLAIPAAATIQIAAREYLEFRREQAAPDAPAGPVPAQPAPTSAGESP
jgi:predicted PurR-regulated permease PerM